MKPSQNCIDMIKLEESFRDTAYRDAVGIWTIGYGTTHNVQEGDTCTEAEACQKLADDLYPFAKDVTNLVHVELNQNQFDALCDFVYNLGPEALQHSTLLIKINAKKFDEAAKEFVKWNHAGGRVLAGLTKRREAECNLFLTPV